ncbi:hypothetical protein AV530_017193 [Patagioenas fasciata monilis]|uniref:Uncharacterized protein n=1 Tax=Patagioenas fasciata monilis TaxID=372326 RepID=A0A1V4JGE2_PATFA|nr:hypothetical protein AV530_017193 [Patagioenas fasciata monilis]
MRAKTPSTEARVEATHKSVLITTSIPQQNNDLHSSSRHQGPSALSLEHLAFHGSLLKMPLEKKIIENFLN